MCWRGSAPPRGLAAQLVPILDIQHRLGTPHRGTRLAQQEEPRAERLHPSPPSFIPSTSPTASLGMSGEVSSAQHRNTLVKREKSHKVPYVYHTHTLVRTLHVPGLGIAQRAAQEQPRSGRMMFLSHCQTTLRPHHPPAPAGASCWEENSFSAPLTSPALTASAPGLPKTYALIPHNLQISQLIKKKKKSLKSLWVQKCPF